MKWEIPNYEPQNPKTPWEGFRIRDRDLIYKKERSKFVWCDWKVLELVGNDVLSGIDLIEITVGNDDLNNAKNWISENGLIWLIENDDSLFIYKKRAVEVQMFWLIGHMAKR